MNTCFFPGAQSALDGSQIALSDGAELAEGEDEAMGK